jgi:presenilin-like A22 family membrane protease
MFLITQFIGLYVINVDIFNQEAEVNGEMQPVTNPILSSFQPPEIQQQSDFGFYFGSLIFAFVFAILLFFLLTKFKIDSVLRAWFFVVIIISLFITFSSFFPNLINSIPFIIAILILAVVLAFIKTYRRNIIIHNLTELLIYPGIATIFVPILNFWTVIVLLIIISIYDMWAVWHSGIMQKMAKYQMNTLRVFSGFFVPYVSKKMRMQINKMKKSKLKNKKIKVNLAILGGGDVVFPIITAGVILKTASVDLSFLGLPAFIGGLIPALFVIFGAFIGLALLFSFSEKKKFYPAMPFITAGIFLGILVSYLLFSFVLIIK